MSSRRIAKIAEAVREVVSSVVLFELRDPRIRHVTVLRAEVADDLRSAKVFVSVMGNESAQRLAIRGLESARGFIQSRIADELKLRQTPVLSFVLDQGVKKSIEVSRLLRAMQEETPPAGAEQQDASATGDSDEPDRADEAEP